MKTIISLLFVGLCLPVYAQQPDLLFEFSSTSVYSISDPERNEFKSFLDERLAQLQQKIPTLNWQDPETFEKIQQAFQNLVIPISPLYKNRQFDCDFLARISARSSSKVVKNQIQQLTRNGRVCTPGDLPKEQRVAWAEDLLKLLWLSPWIQNENQHDSLESLLIKKLGAENYRRPVFVVNPWIEFDGYGWGYSENEKALFNSDPSLQKYVELGASYDPTKEDDFSALGPALQKALKEYRYDALGIVHLRSEIHISASWAPTAIVDLLVHEYGHVFHGEQDDNIQWNLAQKTLSFHQHENAHTECVSESMAWNILKDLFPSYPEIEFFHLAKLRLFAHFRANDPHLIGAVAQRHHLHSLENSNTSDLFELAKSVNLNAYLQKKNIPLLTVVKVNPQDELPIYLARDIP